MEPRKKSVNLDDFEIIKLLGKGQYGKVLLVRKKNSQNLYAMKILKKKVIKERNQISHVLSERSALSRVNHPCIVHLNYAFHNKKNLYMVMEYCPGGELFFHLSKFQKLPESLSKFYTACIVLALNHLHTLNILYRDLKPENIVISSNGYPKLTDFGLCKENISQSSTTCTVCGTPEYIAPEVILRQGYSLTVDWWSLGCIIFEMLTGYPPFYSNNRKEIFKNIVKNPVVCDTNISSNAKDLIRKLLVKDPQFRLGSRGAAEVMQHQWFDGIDWEKLEKAEDVPPYVPNINGPLDTSWFSEEFTQQTVESPVMSPPVMGSANFKGFSYNGSTGDEICDVMDN